MKKVFFISATICCSLVLKAQTDQQPYITKPLADQNISSARMEGSGGSISVTGVNASEARLEVFVTPNNNENLSKEEIQKRLDEYYTMDISISKGQLVATVRPKHAIENNWKKAVNVSFKAYLPVNVTTDLETSGGSIALSNLNGTNTFTTSGGSISVDHVTGKMKGRGSGGSIHVANSSNDIDLVTSGGSIHAKDCTGDIRLRTSGGSLELDNLDGKIDAETSGGSVHADEIKGELVTSTSGGSIKLSNLSCSVEAETSGGGIDAEIIGSTKDVKLRNSGGNIDLELPANKGFDLNLNANKINVDLKNFSGSADDNSIEGKINGGGVLVDVRASSGRINVSFK
jgi:hypothetical protein